MNSIPQKTCSRCGQSYPATREYFSSSPKTKSGLRAYCKPCGVVYSREYAKCHPDKTRQIKQEWVNRNPQKRRDTANRYARNNRPKIKEAGANWRHKHPQKALDQQRRYKSTHKEAYRGYKHKRRAKQAKLPYTLTDVQWQHCLRHFNGCCAVCGRPSGLWHTIAMDHWIPISDPECPGTTAKNVLPLCHGIDGCNNKKHARNPSAWLIEEYGEREALRILRRIEDYFNSLNH